MTFAFHSRRFAGLLLVLGAAGCGLSPGAPDGPAPSQSSGDAASGAGGTSSSSGSVGGASSSSGSVGGAAEHAGGGGAGGAPMPAPTRTVLLIPGTTITGDYFDTMAARLTADGFAPRVFVPPDLFTDSLALGAQRIADEVQATLAETGEARLDIVAECDGGVATRYWLEVLGGAASVDQVVTFVSAHHGTWSSPVGSWVTGWQALDDITPGSAFLETLNGAAFPAGLKLTSIYTCHDEYLYPYETSVVDQATNVLFCDRFVTHFDGFWDPVVYARILATLQGHGDQQPTQY